jgi:hypothetical protein
MTYVRLEHSADVSQTRPQLRFCTVIGVLLPAAFGIYCMYSSMTMRDKHVKDDRVQSLILRKSEPTTSEVFDLKPTSE